MLWISFLGGKFHFLNVSFCIFCQIWQVSKVIFLITFPSCHLYSLLWDTNGMTTRSETVHFFPWLFSLCCQVGQFLFFSLQVHWFFLLGIIHGGVVFLFLVIETFSSQIFIWVLLYIFCFLLRLSISLLRVFHLFQARK